MLAQLLERAGFASAAISIGSVDAMMREVASAEPEVVCLSALPPYALSHARRFYRNLRLQYPQIKIMIGLWNCPEDSTKAAREISGGEQNSVCTTLAQAISQAGVLTGGAALPQAELANAVVA
jgi:hypothetical protein